MENQMSEEQQREANILDNLNFEKSIAVKQYEGLSYIQINGDLTRMQLLKRNLELIKELAQREFNNGWDWQVDIVLINSGGYIRMLRGIEPTWNEAGPKIESSYQFEGFDIDSFGHLRLIHLPEIGDEDWGPAEIDYSLVIPVENIASMEFHYDR